MLISGVTRRYSRLRSVQKSNAWVFPPPEQHRATVNKLAPGTLPMQCAAIAIGLIDKHYDRKFVSSVPASEMTDVAGLRVGVEFAELDRPDLFQHARRSPYVRITYQ